MRFSTVRVWVLLAAICLSALGAGAQVPSRIVERIDIKHVGPPAASDELIRANIRIKVGEPYLRTTADDDVRNLFATGYFYNIRIGEEQGEKGVILTYVVQGKPTLTEIRFEGNKKYKRSKLVTKCASKVGEPLNERKLFADAEEIKKYYQKQGYQRTEVKYVVTIDENAGRGTATFEIVEKPKVRVVDVQFVNASAYKQKKLRGLLKTRRWFMFSWITNGGKLKDDEFEEDKETLVDFYRSEGYIDFTIKDIQFDYTQPTRLTIRFIISEGVRYKIGSIAFKGNTLFKDDWLRERMPVGVGKIFTPKALSRDLEFFENAYGSKGYIDARVGVTKVPNTEKGTIDLAFNVEEKQASYIEKIEIKGNTKTKDRVIRRELAVSPGEIFDMVRVKLSTNRLTGLNYFEKIDAKPEPTDVPNRKNLVIGVDEKSTGNFSIGAGFSSVDNLVGFVEVSQGNFDLFNPWFFTGGGQKFRLRAQIGTQRQDYLLSFIEPWFLGRKLALGVDLYHRDLNFQSSLYNERRTGARFSLTKALGSEFLIGSVSYTLESAGIRFDTTNAVSTNLLNEAGTKIVSKVGASLAYDTRNSALLPNRGQRTEILGEVAGGPLGGDVNFYKLELRSAWYFKGFAPGHVLEVVGRVGVTEAFDDTADVPLFDRYYLGGLYSLRGFEYRKVGPKDVFGEALGGDTYYFGSVEYSMPIIDRLRFALFYDIGMVFKSPYSFSEGTFNTGKYNDNFGFGIRLNLPIGPLRLDYGIPITSDPQNKGSGKFQFGVGYTREL
ncbi:MAG TPA: outer membrane protein assembly factor BamA [Verrucomicrobiae bacterium]|jgi:outer membrane protein insertion porin family